MSAASSANELTKKEKDIVENLDDDKEKEQLVADFRSYLLEDSNANGTRSILPIWLVKNGFKMNIFLAAFYKGKFDLFRIMLQIFTTGTPFLPPDKFKRLARVTDTVNDRKISLTQLLIQKFLFPVETPTAQRFFRDETIAQSFLEKLDDSRFVFFLNKVVTNVPPLFSNVVEDLRLVQKKRTKPEDGNGDGEGGGPGRGGKSEDSSPEVSGVDDSDENLFGDGGLMGSESDEAEISSDDNGVGDDGKTKQSSSDKSDVDDSEDDEIESSDESDAEPVLTPEQIRLSRALVGKAKKLEEKVLELFGKEEDKPSRENFKEASRKIKQVQKLLEQKPPRKLDAGRIRDTLESLQRRLGNYETRLIRKQFNKASDLYGKWKYGGSVSAQKALDGVKKYLKRMEKYDLKGETRTEWKKQVENLIEELEAEAERESVPVPEPQPPSQPELVPEPEPEPQPEAQRRQAEARRVLLPLPPIRVKSFVEFLMQTPQQNDEEEIPDFEKQENELVMEDNLFVLKSEDQHPLPRGVPLRVIYSSPELEEQKLIRNINAELAAQPARVIFSEEKIEPESLRGANIFALKEKIVFPQIQSGLFLNE